MGPHAKLSRLDVSPGAEWRCSCRMKHILSVLYPSLPGKIYEVLYICFPFSALNETMSLENYFQMELMNFLKIGIFSRRFWEMLIKITLDILVNILLSNKNIYVSQVSRIIPGQNFDCVQCRFLKRHFWDLQKRLIS